MNIIDRIFRREPTTLDVVATLEKLDSAIQKVEKMRDLLKDPPKPVGKNRTFNEHMKDWEIAINSTRHFLTYFSGYFAGRGDDDVAMLMARLANNLFDLADGREIDTAKITEGLFEDGETERKQEQTEGCTPGDCTSRDCASEGDSPEEERPSYEGESSPSSVITEETNRDGTR